MKRLLITGVSGFVGGHIMSAAAGKYEVHGTSHTRQVSFPDTHIHTLDLSDTDQIVSLVELIKPDAVIHTAAWGNLERCERDPDKAMRINADAAGILAEQTGRVDGRVIYVSTDMVFDGTGRDHKEDDPVNPIQAYGRSKLAGEQAAMDAHSRTVAGRAALIYGRPVTGSNSFSEKILSKVMSGESYNLYTDQYRTPVLVNDLAAALLELAGGDYEGVIHLGGSERMDRYEFGLTLAEIAGFDAELLNPISMKEVQTEAPRPKDASLNISRARTVLNTELRDVRHGLSFSYVKSL